MKVEVFAVLKEHFEKEFELNKNVENTAALKNYLIEMRPETRGILNNCRFAVNNEFVDMNFKLGSNDTIYIVPPSSGG